MDHCKYCGKEIPISFGNRRVFCSDECSKAYYKRASRKNKICEICGGDLVGNQRKYCTDCKAKARSKYEYEYHKEEYKKPEAEEKPKKRGRPKKSLNLEQAAKLAKAEGLSWGEYYIKHRLYEKEM